MDIHEEIRSCILRRGDFVHVAQLLMPIDHISQLDKHHVEMLVKRGF